MSRHPVTVRNIAEGTSSTPGAVAAFMGPTVLQTSGGNPVTGADVSASSYLGKYWR